MPTSADIRQQFLNFFRARGHEIVPSAPIVVKNDPTLLFTNAGMNPFKDYFLGNSRPPHPRLADTQKCLRVSGKHNDLEEVGVDTYHHTMFEMLGNWSFGDYFKKESLQWSWELLTEVYQIDKNRLYVTYFEGDAAEGLPADEETLEIWKTLVPAERILRGGKKDNFWEMGDTGPCGPCSEIHVDCRSEAERAQIPGHSLVNAGDPQVIEIWNNVFIQYNRQKDGSLQPLPQRHVDTGMGLERLVRVIQGKRSNYDTDLFMDTIREVEIITGKTYDGGDSREAIAFRVLADHIRAISFTIADGQLPSNTGAGYVIRRILRRAARYYYAVLGFREPLLYRLVPGLAERFRNVFPELNQQSEFVVRVVKEEEEAFLRTLGNGLKLFYEYVGQADQDKQIPGAFAFRLSDTYGFPVDLTQLLAREEGWTVDMEGFQQEMNRQKDRSRAATATDAGDWVVLREGSPVFRGYETLQTETRLLRYRRVRTRGKDQYQLVLEETPFFAESGGQVGDQGILHFGEEKIEVLDTRRENDLIIHLTGKLPSDIRMPVRAEVQADRRLHTARNHTGTHLLHAALRRVLGTHVTQKGSLVSGELLRFDFSHFARVSEEELRKVEELVNAKIRENIPVETREMPREQALQSGAMALFGEKYGETVRVVTAGSDFSVELCGGTHVSRTGDIGVFLIRSESAVAAGVRRIEALTGEAALGYIQSRLDEHQRITELLRTREPLAGVSKLLEENAQLGKKLEAMENRHLVQVRNDLLHKDEIINGVTFVGEIVQVSNADALKKLCFDLKNNLNDHLAVICANIGGKAHVAIGIADTVVAARQLDASRLIREKVAPLIKGGGGGQKTLATAGGTDPSRLREAIDAVRQML